MDPTKEIGKLVSEGKYEEAFTKVLCMSDVAMVAWLCSQVSDGRGDVPIQRTEARTELWQNAAEPNECSAPNDYPGKVQEGKRTESGVQRNELNTVHPSLFLYNLPCQVAPPLVFTKSGSALSQGVLLALVQQLGTDLQREPSTKLPWICSASLALQPRHPQIGSHVRPILDPLFHSLHAGMNASQTAGNTPLSQEYGRAMRAVASVLSKC